MVFPVSTARAWRTAPLSAGPEARGPERPITPRPCAGPSGSACGPITPWAAWDSVAPRIWREWGIEMRWLILPVFCAAAWPSDGTGNLPENSLYQLESSWQRDDGTMLHLSDLRGKARVFSMFFSRCD